MTFPNGFLWGTATSSYQIEGASLEDGRGECIWHRFSHTPGKVNNGDNGDVACNHYYNYKEDVALMKELGVNAYRFSIAWPRVLPQGVGQINELGIDFYSRLVDELLETGIRPFVTLYHWDLPQALQDKGGWTNPDMVKWFGDYTALIAKTIGDRVNDWITLNEPFVVSFVGNYYGRHAPGNQHMPTALKVAHYELLSHGKAVQVLRELLPNPNIGITLDYAHCEPATDDPKDMLASTRFDGFHNRWFYDPVFKGEYPQDMIEVFGDALEGINVAEIAAAQQPIDFLGVNYYTRTLSAWNEDYKPLQHKTVFEEGRERTLMNWEVYPDGLRQSLVRINQAYQPKAIYITENGSSFEDAPPVNGVVEDPRRVAYLNDHLNAVSQAIEEGVPVEGYFAWSLLDNFEWAEGYAKRFGIVYVDFETQQRTLKRSAHVYRDWIAQHTVPTPG